MRTRSDHRQMRYFVVLRRSLADALVAVNIRAACKSDRAEPASGIGRACAPGSRLPPPLPVLQDQERDNGDSDDGNRKKERVVEDECVQRARAARVVRAVDQENEKKAS